MRRLGLLGSRVALVLLEPEHSLSLHAATTAERARFGLTCVPKLAIELERYMADALSGVDGERGCHS